MSRIISINKSPYYQKQFKNKKEIIQRLFHERSASAEGGEEIIPRMKDQYLLILIEVASSATYVSVSVTKPKASSLALVAVVNLTLVIDDPEREPTSRPT
jgi:hypothetical protein